MGIPVLLSLFVCGLVAAGCLNSQDPERPDRAGGASATRVVAPAGEATLELPDGWQLLSRRISGVIDPVQVFAAASYPVDERARRPGGTCTPGRVLVEKPADGALVQVVETGVRPLRRLPERAEPFRLPRDAYASYECNGPSYNISFRDRGRGFQAFVWLDPQRVHPRVLNQTIQLLSSMRFERGPARPLHETTPGVGGGWATEPCPVFTSGVFGAGNWRGRVANISCRTAGKLILRRLGREFRPTTAESGTHRSVGFRCTWRTLSDEPGWSLACVRGDEVITFGWTP